MKLFADELRRETRRGRKRATVVHPVTLELRESSALGLVGGRERSGTVPLAGMLAGLVAPTAGTLELDGEPVRDLLRNPAGRKRFRRHVQFVGVETSAGFDARRTLAEAVAGPLKPLRRITAEAEIKERLTRTAASLGLDPALYQMHVMHLSPEELHRIALVRALVVEPALLVLDDFGHGLPDPVRELVLRDLRIHCRVHGIGLVCTAAEAPVLHGVVDEVLVMNSGRVVDRQTVRGSGQGHSSTVGRTALRSPNSALHPAADLSDP
ncbi:ATP-binding cassette domain-containing protein [Brevibacterium litoralis]|uniref:ATP-binding cassette domain-containing protein n=1 Tax=Brevibacterium litoralis TaxID=3138935 RepID=UPI0032EB68EF